jgi:chaperone modulatory protein CbpM
MPTEFSLIIDLQEVCLATGLNPEQLGEIVAHDIIAPAGDAPTDWLFDLQMLSTAKQALRLQRDLHLDWASVALILNLLDERDRLRSENEILQQRLQRFLCD